MPTTLEKRRPMWLATFIPIALLGLFLIYAFTAMMGKSLFEAGDGYLMQYTQTVYAKEFWTGLLSGNMPLLQFTNGEGLDTITTMTYYGLFDPLNLVYVITPETALTGVFTILTLFKMLLSGLTFGLYAQRYTDNHKAISLGALVYTFTGFSLLWLSYPAVTSSCYIFPLMLMALDVALDNNKCIWFAVMTMWAYMANYYMAATMSFMLLTYALIRMFMANEWNKSAWFKYIKTAAAHAIGIAATSVIVLPVILAILSGARDGTSAGYRDSLLWFNWEYYFDIFVGLFTPFDGMNKYWGSPYKFVAHFLCVAAPALVMFLGSKTEKKSPARRLKLALILCCIFIAIPAFSILFNGTMYATHRWLFASNMVMGMIVVWAGTQWSTMSKRVRLISAVLLIGGSIASCWMIIPRVAIIAIVMSVIVSLVMLIKPRYLTAYIATILSIVMMLFSSFVAAGYVVDFSPNNVSDKPHTGIYSAVELTDEELDEFIRVAVTNTSYSNEAFLLGYKGTTGVWNIMPSGVCEFNTDAMMLTDTDTDFWVHGWDDRTALQTLAAAKYYITTEAKRTCVPYGFTEIKSVDITSHDRTTQTTTYYVYKNNYDVSVGYMLYNNMSAEEFYSLDVASKQLALMQYSINTHTTTPSGYQSSVHELTPAITTVNKSNSTHITMSVEVPENCELYLYIEDASLIKDAYKLGTSSFGQLQKYQESKKDTTIDSSHEPRSFAHILVSAKNEDGITVHKDVLTYRPTAHLTSGKPYRAINLGHQMAGKTEVTLGFYNEYVNTNGFHLFAMPLDEYDNAAQTLEKNLLHDVTYDDTNDVYLSGKINASQDGVLQVAIPYSTGWKAYVDGEPVATFASGIKYIGINVAAGEHDIRLEYSTPGFGYGIMISITAIFIMLLWFILEYGAKIKALFKHPKYAPLLRYLVCGCGTTLLDFIIYMSLAGLGLMIPVAKFSAGCMTTIVSFFLNRNWSFGAQKGNVANQGWKFVITQLLNISVNTLVNSLVLAVIDIKLIAFGFATLAGMTVSFLLQRFWVFRKKGEND